MLQIERNGGERHPATQQPAIVRWLEEVGLGDIEIVGGKNASLGEMIRQLAGEGIKVPPGFATTAHGYRRFLNTTDLGERLHDLFADLDVEDIENLRRHGQTARRLILETPFPPVLRLEIVGAYRELRRRCGADVRVAVRSSATAEDLPNASFAGQQETYLNIYGEQNLLDACRRCFASLFTDRAISYRQTQGFDHFSIALSVGVQKMVRSDLAASGVMFTLDPETGFPGVVLINAAYGLGENVVQGAVNPDEYVVFKPTLEQGFCPILDRRLGSKALRLVYAADGSPTVQNLPVPEEQQGRFALQDQEILQLARWGCRIEAHYSRLRGVPSPMDIEWAKDGITGELFILQARPETVQSRRSQAVLRTYRLRERTAALLSGRSIGSEIGQGKSRVILDPKHLDQFQPGEVLVTDRTDPDWEPVMKKAAAIVTNQGGRTCHAAIIARELGVPAIVGTGNATTVLAPGEPVTVDCAVGEEGQVYAGLLPFDVEEISIEAVPRPRTRILLNVGNPAEAFRLAALPVDGVGLARLEFIIANHIRIHPLALVHFDRLAEGEAKAEIERLTAGTPFKPDYFVDRLAQGAGTIAAAFYPRPVIVRLSDFKTNEYASLLGGQDFEPPEENPMLGWRGASRYYDGRYREGFALECRAMKRIRDEMGLTNVLLMVPFCRTPAEGRRVIAEMARHGLVRGENGLEIYVMCELPSNVILAEQFSAVFDGFSIGSNDLTQLTLGVDRDSATVAGLFDERDEAVRWMISTAIRTAKRCGRKIGLCGQGPSDYPEFARFLVEEQIDSISLNPDVVMKTLIEVTQLEKGGTAR